MSLSSDLVSQFVKSTNDSNKKNVDTTIYGEVVPCEGGYNNFGVKLDGSDQITPLSSSSVLLRPGERISVTIKNHKAVATGSMSQPAISEVEIDGFSTDKIEAIEVNVQNLIAKDADITGRLEASEADIETLITEDAVIKDRLVAAEANIQSINTLKLNATDAEITYATIDSLEAVDAKVYSLEGTHGEFKELTTDKLEAHDAVISSLDANYANIDFSNIGKAAMELFYSNSGLIDNVTIGDGTITGKLVGVTISGDLIEGNTVVAEKLVIKGSDGLYYKLNTDGVKMESEQTDYNSINGSVIKAKSITATKISVDDLVAFDATIGGFNITDNSLYSGVKETVDNTTRGIYLDNDGQMAIGDANNYIKYYKDTDGTYKLAISAKSISISGGTDVETALGNMQSSIDDIEVGGRNYVLGSDEERRIKTEYYQLYDVSEKIVNLQGYKATVSFDAKRATNSTKVNMYVYLRDSNGIVCQSAKFGDVSDEYVRYTCSIACADDLSNVKYLAINTTVNTSDVYVKNVKLEKGNRPTDWTPAPEDDITAIENVRTSVDELEVGGRNLFTGSSDFSGPWLNINMWPVDGTDKNGNVVRKRTGSWSGLSQYVPAKQGEVYILSANVRGDSVSTLAFNVNEVVEDDPSSGLGSASIRLKSYYTIAPTVETRIRSIPYIVTKDCDLRIRVENGEPNGNGTLWVSSLKLEKGNRATDWTPAPEDVQNGINNAGKTATNFVTYDSTNGLQLGNKTSGSWSGFRTQITSSAFNVLNAAGAAIASYGAKLIELGKNATDAVIKLCGGKGQIAYITDDDTSENYLQISADKIRVKSSEKSSVYSMYTNNSTRWEKSAANISPKKVSLYASECIDPTMVEKVEGWNTSEVLVNPDNITASTPGHMSFISKGGFVFDGAPIRDSHGNFMSVVTGTSGIWTYKKWSNGYVELWGSYAVSNMACTTALGNMYRTNVFSPSSFPFTVHNPNVVANYESDGYGAFLWATTTATTSTPPNYYLVRPTSTTIANGKINFHVRGRWMN